MELLRQTPDKYYGLCIVDPPYGINVANMNLGTGTGKRQSKMRNRKWRPKDWDASKPRAEYFDELFRVSERQVIWGGNYFELPPSQYFAIWDKGEGIRGRSFAEGEFAWVSDGGTRITTIDPVDRSRIHPTQKPVALYRWLLKNYAKPGDKILDTHGGSMSIAIACDIEGFDLTLCEIDPDYFAAGKKRLEQHQSAPRLFAPEPAKVSEQMSIDIPE